MSYLEHRIQVLNEEEKEKLDEQVIEKGMTRPGGQRCVLECITKSKQIDGRTDRRTIQLSESIADQQTERPTDQLTN